MNSYMSPEEFRFAWKDSGSLLRPIDAERVRRFSLQKNTSDFLTFAGLPEYTSSHLFFADNSDDVVYGIVRLVDQYKFTTDYKEYEQYVVIGSCRDGDAIAIDRAKNDIIVELDHEDLFRAKFFNSSIETLADFLVAVRDFDTSVLEQHGEAGRRAGYFTDIQFDQLRNRMLDIDKRAVVEKGFWKDELEIMLSIRQKYIDGVDVYRGPIRRLGD